MFCDALKIGSREIIRGTGEPPTKPLLWLYLDMETQWFPSTWNQHPKHGHWNEWLSVVDALEFLGLHHGHIRMCTPVWKVLCSIYSSKKTKPHDNWEQSTNKFHHWGLKIGCPQSQWFKEWKKAGFSLAWYGMIWVLISHFQTQIDWLVVEPYPSEKWWS
jgi:hypothetical protein